MENWQDKVGRAILPEVEVSITSACSLRCSDCGFNIPQQPNPWPDGLPQLKKALAILEKLQIKIESIAVLGGEPTLSKHLAAWINLLASSEATNKIELVTNGLTPNLLDLEAIRNIDIISISNYKKEDSLIHLWMSWLQANFIDAEVRDRRHGHWDQNMQEVTLTEQEAKRVWTNCWYRKHCVTIERGRLFPCSRSAKFGPDSDGLELREDTVATEIQTHLLQTEPFASCRHCTPMAGLSPVIPAVQPDDRLPSLHAKALMFLRQQLPDQVG